MSPSACCYFPPGRYRRGGMHSAIFHCALQSESIISVEGTHSDVRESRQVSRPYLSQAQVASPGLESPPSPAAARGSDRNVVLHFASISGHLRSCRINSSLSATESKSLPVPTKTLRVEPGSTECRRCCRQAGCASALGATTKTTLDANPAVYPTRSTPDGEH